MTPRTFAWIAATLVGTVLATSSVRADNLDERLLQEAPKVMKFLQTHQYQSVGVLKFRVELGRKPASFNVGAINSNMSRRLQNALILVDDPEKPVGLLEDPNQVAAAKKLPSYLTPAGREALFHTTFPLAWGQNSAKPDAFVTGLVKVDPNMRKGRVTIESFDARSPKMSEVCQFDFDTDRSVLSDLGQGFLVARRGIKATEEDEDKAAAQDAANRDDKKTQGSPLESPDNPVQLEIRYDGSPQQVANDPSSPGELMVAEPQERQAVAFLLKNVSNERVGVVLKVNGRNTLFEEEEEPGQCTKWILDPGEQLEVKGFSQRDDKREIPFKVLSAGESEAVAYTDNLGIIQLCVFRSGGEQMQISRKASLRGLSTSRAAKTARPATLRELQKRTATATKVRSNRGVLEKDLDAVAKVQDFKTVDFPHPTQVADLKIRYYKPRGSSGSAQKP